MNRSPLSLMMPDADSLTGAEIAATLDLSPAAMLCCVYAEWDSDKGVAQQISNLVRALGHDRLFVRFHADPNPIAYAHKIGGPEAWGRLCARRMGWYYGSLGVQLHAILANEVDADYEGNLDPKQASDFYRRSLGAYGAERPDDILHVPAPTGAPDTHRRYLAQYISDGWLVDKDDNPKPYWIDGHGYDGDLGNVCDVLESLFPDHYRMITETNDVDLATAAAMVGVRAHAICYFTLNWARGGEGRIQPPTPDDAAKHMSLLRFPDSYGDFKATIRPEHVNEQPAPEPMPNPPLPEPEPVPEHTPDPAPTAPAPVYDYTTPAIAQNDPWSCAPTSARWAMTAWGRHPSEQWFESTMLADGVVSKDLGLLDASGAGLAAWLSAQYGEFNFAAYNTSPVSFDNVVNVHEHMPALIGGRAWGHWSGVRGYDPAADTLQLANPSSGWMGVSQTMSRQQFDALGPFSMVVVAWTDPAPPVVEPPAPQPEPAPGFRVGPGVLAEMARRGDEPITSEVYHKDDKGITQYSETLGRSGSRYAWAPSTGLVYVTHTDVTAAGRS